MIALLKACLQRTLLLKHLHSRAIVTVNPLLNNKPTDQEAEEVAIPDPPTTCCMSGCANCVWIDYAKELAAIYNDGGQAAEKVMKTIDDPSLKIFLSLELKEALKNTN